MARDSQTTTSPSTSAGSFPDGEYLRISARTGQQGFSTAVGSVVPVRMDSGEMMHKRPAEGDCTGP